MKKRLSRKWWQNTLTGYAFIGVFCIGFICFTVILIPAPLQFYLEVAMSISIVREDFFIVDFFFCSSNLAI